MHHAGNSKRVRRTSRLGDREGLTPRAARMSSAVRATTGFGLSLGWGVCVSVQGRPQLDREGQAVSRRCCGAEVASILKAAAPTDLCPHSCKEPHLSLGSLWTHTTASTLPLRSISRAMPGQHVGRQGDRGVSGVHLVPYKLPLSVEHIKSSPGVRDAAAGSAAGPAASAYLSRRPSTAHPRCLGRAARRGPAGGWPWVRGENGSLTA